MDLLASQTGKMTSFWAAGKMKGDPFTNPFQLAVKPWDILVNDD